MVSKGLISGCLGWRLALGFAPRIGVIPAHAGIQYAAASRFFHRRLWNTGSPACAGDDSGDVALAFTKHTFAIPRRNARVMQNRFSQKQGSRECRVRAAPAVSCAIVQQDGAHEHTGQRRASDIPCAMALRLISCSPRRDGLYCHRRPSEALAPERLDAVTGVRTTRLYRTPMPRPSSATSASTASHPASGRSRYAPRRGMRRERYAR